MITIYPIRPPKPPNELNRPQLADRKTESQKDRKTERQKDRKTERPKDRKTERQTEGEKEGEKETQVVLAIHSFRDASEALLADSPLKRPSHFPQEAIPAHS